MSFIIIICHTPPGCACPHSFAIHACEKADESGHITVLCKFESVVIADMNCQCLSLCTSSSASIVYVMWNMLCVCLSMTSCCVSVACVLQAAKITCAKRGLGMKRQRF